MNFRVYVPERRHVPNDQLVRLAELANHRWGRPLESGVSADELLLEAELRGLVEPVPPGSSLDGHHVRYYSRADLVRLAKRKQIRAKRRAL